MKVEVYSRKKGKWGYKVKKGNTIVARNRRLYPTRAEAFAIGKNHKEFIIER